MPSTKLGQECQIIEWKWSWKDEYLKWLCGYANTDGGTLYLGVNDDGYVVGLKDTKRLLELLPNKITDSIGVLTSINVYTANGAENIRYNNEVPARVANKLINRYARGEVSTEKLAVEDKSYKALKKIEKENGIWENEDGEREYLSIEVIPYPFAVSYDGKFYKRSDSTLRLLEGLELQKFLLEKAGISWDAMPIPEVSVSELSKEALDTFRKKAVKNKRMTKEEVNVSDELLLRNLKLYEKNDLTRAALLLFHPDPEQFATGAYIKLRFFAPVRAGKEGERVAADLLYQDVINGPLIMQVDKAIDLIFTKYFKFLIDYEGIQRVETPMLSRDMVREILLNAVNHKDYATGVPIQVAIYDDHIDVFNTGDWPASVPFSQAIYEKHESVPHNPKIANVSFRSGEVEAWGRGYLKIKLECEAINAPLPTIDVRKGGVSVRADGCEQYMRLLRYGQYGQVGADGEWMKVGVKDENETSLKQALKNETSLKQVLKNETSLKQVLKQVLPESEYEKLLPIIIYLEDHETITPEIAIFLTKKSRSTAWRYLQRLVSLDILEPVGNTNLSEYKKKERLEI